MKTNLRTIPEHPKFTDHRDPTSYYNLNKYFNECVKWFTEFERELKKIYDKERPDVRPYTGEYGWGICDLINGILGEPEDKIDKEVEKELPWR